MTLRADEVVAGRFTVVKVLGEGGMGVVYEVLDGRFRAQRRALKMLKPGRETDAALRQRFVDEVVATARIQSEHVIKVVDHDCDAPAPWMLMELLDGETLDDHVRARGPLPLDDARRWLVELGHAIGAAHAEGVLHLDLKPTNLYLARASDAHGTTRLKVLDFGISRQIRDGRTHVNQSRAIGSEAWMAYEQFNKGAELRPQSDVWSFGLLAFWMLSGVSYWLSVNAQGDIEAMGPLIGEIYQGATALASARAAERGVQHALPEGFDAWFAKCLAKEPHDRWPDGGAASRALDGVLGRASRGASVPPPVATPPPPPPVAPPVTPPAPPTRQGTAEVERPLPPSGFTQPVGTPPEVRPIAPERRRPVEVAPPPPKPSRTPWIAAGGVALVLAGALGLRGCPEEPPASRDAGAEAAADVVVAVLPQREPTCPEGMALIRGGTFRMGSPEGVGETDEHPAHDVTVGTFCIDRTEVSVAEYQACVTAGACSETTTVNWSGITSADHRQYDRVCNARHADRANHPMNCLDWSQARAYCTWSDNPRGVGRLPWESEWEFAARGTVGRKYPWGDTPEPDGSRVNLCGAECATYWRSLGFTLPTTISGWRDNFGGTAPVDSFEPGETPEHVRNLAGNVWEWVEDVYVSDAYAQHTSEGHLRARDASATSQSTELRVLRGGSWNDDNASVARAAIRVSYDPTFRNSRVGVRCARGAR